MFCRRAETPFGKIAAEVSDHAVRRVWLPGTVLPEETPEQSPLLEETLRQLREYFSGKRQVFDLPLDPEGTVFRRKVWRTLKERIPFGQCVSYGELARMAGVPKAARAVGSAMHNNPIPVIIPCHRVLAAGEKIGGFGGGLPLKRKMLELEGVRLAF